jgi:hypothetical protein
VPPDTPDAVMAQTGTGKMKKKIKFQSNAGLRKTIMKLNAWIRVLLQKPTAIDRKFINVLTAARHVDAVLS